MTFCLSKKSDPLKELIKKATCSVIAGNPPAEAASFARPEEL
jgi:hypothetical protein